MVVAHNLQGMNAQRQYGVVTSDRNKSMEKLSSGYKINRAADDAAGLTISEKMRSQIRGLTQASTNAEDGISFIQIADGALNEVHDMLDRMVELTVKSSNGTNTDADRDAIQKEIAELTNEINRVHETSEFNTIRTFTENGHSPDDAIDNGNVAISGSVASMSIVDAFLGQGDAGIPAASVTQAGATTSYPAEYNDFIDFVKDSATNAINKLSSAYGEMFKAASSGVQIGLDLHSESSGGVLATASVNYYVGSDGSANPPFSYKMFVDTADYDPTKFSSMSAEKKADLAATIAHEMTHLVMYDTLSNKMMGDRFPKWFIEGMAQTASGDNGWVSSQLSPSASPEAMKNYMSQITSMPYGAGYMGVMTLGLEIQKAQTGDDTLPAKTANILAGLNTLFKDMVDQEAADKGIDADASIRNVTKGEYTSFSDYVNKFKSGSSGTLSSFSSIMSERGTTGAGSLLAPSLNTSEASTFATLDTTPTTSFNIDPDHLSVANKFTSRGFKPVKLLGGGNGSSNGRYDDGRDLFLQVGAAKGQEIKLMRFDMSADAIFGGQMVNAETEESAKNSISVVNDAIARVSKVRSYYGAVQNRLEHTIKNLDNVVENTQAAESQIRDTDMASEMVKLTKNNILMQAGEAMMAQANQSTQGVLSLLQ